MLRYLTLPFLSHLPLPPRRNRAERAIDSLDPIFARKYDALAVTQGFQGSPHIDKQNIGPFYGLALGDFDEGTGGIRVECSARVVGKEPAFDSQCYRKVVACDLPNFCPVVSILCSNCEYEEPPRKSGWTLSALGRSI